MSDNHNAIIFDWLSFTSLSDGVEDLKALLGLSHVQWIELERPFNGYTHSIYFNGITICWGVPQSWGGEYHKDTTYVNMSGSGCRAYETHSSNCDWNSLLALLVSCDDYHISRLDVSYDDFDNILDMDIIYCESLQRDHMITTFRRGFWELGILNAKKERTVYFGSKKSNLMFRIYDKKEERNRSDLSHWVRWEIQLRDDRACTFVRKYIENDYNIGEVFAGVIYNYLRFVEPEENDTNNRRWGLQAWYRNFIGEAEKIKLFEKKDEEYNLYKLKQTTTKKFGGATATYIQAVGVTQAVKDIFKDCSKRNPKYIKLKQELDSQDNLIPEMDLLNRLDYLERMGLMSCDLSQFEHICENCDDIASVLSRLPDLYNPIGGVYSDTLASP